MWIASLVTTSSWPSAVHCKHDPAEENEACPGIFMLVWANPNVAWSAWKTIRTYEIRIWLQKKPAGCSGCGSTRMPAPLEIPETSRKNATQYANCHTKYIFWEKSGIVDVNTSTCRSVSQNWFRMIQDNSLNGEDWWEDSMVEEPFTSFLNNERLSWCLKLRGKLAMNYRLQTLTWRWLSLIQRWAGVAFCLSCLTLPSKPQRTSCQRIFLQEHDS